MDKERWLALIIIILLLPTITVPIYEGWVKDTAELATQIVSGLAVCMIVAAVALWHRGGREKPDGALSPLQSKLATENLKRFLEQPRRDEFHDQLKLVYRPLMSAVLEMKEGKDTLPKAGSVGNRNNPWTYNPRIIAQVVDIFEKHLAVIEDEQVRKGWEDNKEYLRKGVFWYGNDQRRWLERIESRYNYIGWWLRSP